jgi:hypothetical protein
MPVNPQNCDIGTLVQLLNPYTNNQLVPTGGPPTGQMDIYMSNPTPTPGGAAGATIQQIQLEVDNRYPGDWTFKGQAQRVAKAVRIPYRYPVMDGTGANANVLYWVEDYLLVGYEGAPGN